MFQGVWRENGGCGLGVRDHRGCIIETAEGLRGEMPGKRLLTPLLSSRTWAFCPNHMKSPIEKRCSAVEAESPRRIRDEKLYRAKTRSWDESCSQHLGVSRRNVEQSIGYFEESGSAFFHVLQLAHIRPEEYRTIAPPVTAQGYAWTGTK